MAKFFVRNTTNPVTSTSPHGIVVDVSGIVDAPAAYAAIHPVVNGDVLTVIPSNLNAFIVTATFTFPGGSSPAVPPTGT